MSWSFFIDVGGTFTDVIAIDPRGGVRTMKLLSSGVMRGVAAAGSTASRIVDPARSDEPDNLWVGYRCTITTPIRVVAPDTSDTSDNSDNTAKPGASDPVSFETRVAASSGSDASLTLDGMGHGAVDHMPNVVPGKTTYELSCANEAPVVAIRYLMGLRLDQPVGSVNVRLGTTRATNALLERKGAKTAFVTTAGFGDILKIGYQDRPELFALNIKKRDELACLVVEIDERIDASGRVLKRPDPTAIRRQLEQVKESGVRAIAICLMHAHTSADHERLIANIANDVGFEQVSISSDVSPLERIVHRGDTTVVDAYLGPVIRSYVDSIRRALPDARFHLMTSAGGLIDAQHIRGKDTILSGPAGGVVGCDYVARRAGCPKAIAFDMGGTSTDVSRVDADADGFEYTSETVKAGVRIMTPMLAVDTVAAGGGSICSFDGQMLTVGPQSAGADPGPAAYGHGGPLTITDVNIYLGRIVTEHFPFRLSTAAVSDRLAKIQEQIQESTNKELNFLEIAEGFRQIANAHMAGAISRISTARGHDLREYTLCAFGGAGGQHACAIARSLGMRRILLSPLAGVLSAVGIGMTDIKRVAQRSVREVLDAAAVDSLHSALEQLSQAVAQQLERESDDDVCLTQPVWTVDACFQGQSSLITVPFGSLDDIGASFRSAHKRTYGYVHENRAIEVRVIRCETTAESPKPDLKYDMSDIKDGPALMHQDLYVDGRMMNVPVFARKNLAADGSSRGPALEGPAIIFDETHTIVLEPGWRVSVLDTGDIIAVDTQRDATAEHVSTESDPIQLELFNRRFASVALHMGATLRRTALSTNVKERLDFSCAVFTPSGDLVVNAPHIPVHLGAMSECVKLLMEDVGPFQPGDVYVTNDPYRGGSHLNDVTVVSPVHDETGTHVIFLVASRAHHAEIGGTRPGSMPPDSRCLAEEGVVIRAFAFQRGDAPQEDKLRALLTAPPYPSRAPDDNLADIAAQVAANQTGIDDLTSIVQRFGLDVVQAYMQHIQKAAETTMRSAIRKLPDGTHTFRDTLDDGSAICVSITIRGEKAAIDFTGTDAVLPGNLNANRAIVTSAVLYCLRCLIGQDIPLNSGVLAPVTITLPVCLLNPPMADDPRNCPAVVGGNVETSQRIVDCIFGALGVVAASQGTMNNLLIGDDSFGYYETICGGGGAGDGFAGADAVHTHMTNTRITDPEVLESRYPVRLWRFAIRKGSGGTGRYRGGDGVVREIEFLNHRNGGESGLAVSIISQRRCTAPYGMNGGGDGSPGRNLLRRVGSGQTETSFITLPAIISFQAHPGDRLIIETPGGGGWGKAPIAC